MRKITALGLILVLTSAGAFAAEKAATKPAEPADCSSLEKQFDTAKKDGVSADKLKVAEKHRAHGASLCMKGQTAEGMKSLKMALAEIGVH
jgi:hypothetical protein